MALVAWARSVVGGTTVVAREAWQPQSLGVSMLAIWGMERPCLKWWPRLPAPPNTCYNIYRSQVSTGPFSMVATRTEPGSEQVMWIDYRTTYLYGDVYYEVTFYNPSEDFESLPSSAGHVVIG